MPLERCNRVLQAVFYNETDGRFGDIAVGDRGAKTGDSIESAAYRADRLREHKISGIVSACRAEKRGADDCIAARARRAGNFNRIGAAAIGGRKTRPGRPSTFIVIRRKLSGRCRRFHRSASRFIAVLMRP